MRVSACEMVKDDWPEVSSALLALALSRVSPPSDRSPPHTTGSCSPLPHSSLSCGSDETLSHSSLCHPIPHASIVVTSILRVLQCTVVIEEGTGQCAM